MMAQRPAEPGMAGEGDADLLGYMSMSGDDPASARDAWAEFYRRHADYLYAVCFRAYGPLLGGEAGLDAQQMEHERTVGRLIEERDVARTKRLRLDDELTAERADRANLESRLGEERTAMRAAASVANKERDAARAVAAMMESTSEESDARVKRLEAQVAELSAELRRTQGLRAARITGTYAAVREDNHVDLVTVPSMDIRSAETTPPSAPRARRTAQ